MSIGPTHLVARLEEKLNGAKLVNNDERKVVAYWGLSGSEQPTSPTSVNVAGVTWQVIWCNTSTLNSTKCCTKCPHQQPAGGEVTLHGAPFWQGTGNDTVIQHAIHQCCPADQRVQLDSLGRVAFNNFRAVIFSCQDQVHSFMLAPFIPHEGDELGKRIRMTVQLIRFLAQTGLNPVRVCVLKGMRENWRKHSRSADSLSRQAQILESNVRDCLCKKADKLIKCEVEFKFIPGDDIKGTESHRDRDLDFEFDRAILAADLIVPYDGSTGNLLARTLAYMGLGVELYAVPWFLLASTLTWPVGEGGFVDYRCWQRPETPLERAVMWKVLGEQAQ